ncbi:adenylosuccinate lyase [Fluviispira multicolorata]|uniref:Adenylosuccinate lyase n=1 Tax=Fluviispira multicolorata TaxID=2654512 RepID=A0A833JEL7_9BACT|nr:adenylosuccinate lyase [Fluviispira multicolorata]KAB8032132.1 adenylosuccinate lyase [Fluviispira multicolorata]
MIERYSRPEMKSIWSEDSKYASWAEVEKAHLSVLIETGEAPAEVLSIFDNAYKSKSPSDYLAREQETGHDVIAFVAEVGDSMGDKGHFLHKGLTSSDVLDTSLSLRTRKSLELITNSLQKLRENLTKRAFEHTNTVCIGRTHGIHAEPMSFGQVLASHFSEFQRAHTEIINAQKIMSFGKLSGAVGTYSQMTPEFELSVLQKLKLQPEAVATQVIPRDRFVTVASAILSATNAVDRFATNMRHWARTELGEVLEPFGKKQKGSSAMPHKKNPILAENLCGLARTIRGFAGMLSENVALWHERDISHSSVERMALPDIFVTADFMLSRCANLVEGMQIRPEAMQANLWKSGGLWASQSVLTALVTSGMNRTEAYELVQSIALEISGKVATNQINKKQFLEDLLQNKKVKEKVGSDKLTGLFDTDRYLRSLPVTFKRVFGITPEEYNRKNSEAIQNKVPALQKIIKVTVELLPDVLDTEAKTIANDMRLSGNAVIDMRQQKCFFIRMPGNSNPDCMDKYASEVLYNPVIEQFKVEVIQ